MDKVYLVRYGEKFVSFVRTGRSSDVVLEDHIDDGCFTISRDRAGHFLNYLSMKTKLFPGNSDPELVTYQLAQTNTEDEDETQG